MTDVTAPRRRFRPDPAVWATVDATLRRHAARTANALDTRDLAGKLWTRYRNHQPEHRAGHLFELMHAHGFNRDAIGKGAAVRARVTEWVGRPHAAADIELVDASRVVAEAQAKRCGDAAATALGHARAEYAGMQRVSPADQLADVNRKIDKRLALNPDGIRYDAFADARAHGTDRLHAEGVESRPITKAEVDRAAASPVGWANRQVAAEAGRQVGAAAVRGAAIGGAVSGVVETARQTARVRAGETSVAAAATEAAGDTARSAVRAGVLAGLEQGVRIGVAAGRVPAGFGTGTLPGAVAGATTDVAAAGLAYARGTIDGGEFASRSCESALQTGLMWACGTVGQTVIPLPVVGALAGGFVGQWSATVIAGGLAAAVEAAREDALEEERIAVLEAERHEAVATALRMREAVQDLGRERDAYLTAVVAPQLDAALLAVLEGSDDAVALLADLTSAFAGTPVFGTVDEFDAWMRDPDVVLVLDPNMT